MPSILCAESHRDHKPCSHLMEVEIALDHYLHDLCEMASRIEALMSWHDVICVLCAGWYHKPSSSGYLFALCWMVSQQRPRCQCVTATLLYVQDGITNGGLDVNCSSLSVPLWVHGVCHSKTSTGALISSHGVCHSFNNFHTYKLNLWIQGMRHSKLPQAQASSQSLLNLVGWKSSHLIDKSQARHNRLKCTRRSILLDWNGSVSTPPMNRIPNLIDHWMLCGIFCNRFEEGPSIWCQSGWLPEDTFAYFLDICLCCIFNGSQCLRGLSGKDIKASWGDSKLCAQPNGQWSFGIDVKILIQSL